MCERECQSMCERERRSMLIIIHRVHVDSEAWLCLASSHLCVWSTSWYCCRTGSRRHRASSNDNHLKFWQPCRSLLLTHQSLLSLAILPWFGRYVYLYVLPTRFPLPVWMKCVSFGFKVTVDRWCCCVVDRWWIVWSFFGLKNLLELFMAMISAMSSLDMLRMHPSISLDWPSGSPKNTKFIRS